MNKFEEFDEVMGPSVRNMLPGAQCAKINVVFVDPEGTTCVIGLVREGFEDPEEE